MRILRILLTVLIAAVFVVSGKAPQVQAVEFPDYRILVNTSGGVINPGIPDFYEGVAGKSVGMMAWKSGAVGGIEGLGGSHWNFGDGTGGDARSNVIWHTYARPGTYNVSVDVYLSMGEFAWHWSEAVTIYSFLEQPALNINAANGQTTTVFYDLPTLSGDPTALVVDFSGPCNGSSYLSWTGNVSPYDAPRVSINGTLYVTSKGLGQTGDYHFYACSVGPGRTDPISPATPVRQLIFDVTAPVSGTANLHVDSVFLLWKSAPPIDNELIVVRPAPKKGIRLPIERQRAYGRERQQVT